MKDIKKEELVKDINKEELVKYILQTREKRLANKPISEWKVKYNISQSEIWLDIKNSLINTSMKEVYEKGFLPTFDQLLDTVLDDFLKSKKYDPEQAKFFVWSRLKRELLHQPIAIMFNKHLKTSIDFKSVEESFLEKEIPQYLKSEEEIPQYLKSWEDKELFFNNLWEILKEINFADEEIGFVWRTIVS
jgi:hypothetical protein